MPRRATRHPSEPRTTLLLKAGRVPKESVDIFRQVFWKSDFLAEEALSFWREVKKAEPTGLPIQTWKDWTSRRNLSVGQFYNMIHGLTGAGMVEKRGSKWYLSDGFQESLKTMLRIYASEKSPERTATNC